MSLPTKTSPTEATSAKLGGLRTLLEQQKLDAYIVPSNDEHLNEYLPAHCCRREWASNFSGSAGDFIITRKEAWVFVDSRYYEQADLEVDRTVVHISKQGLEGHPSMKEVIRKLAADCTDAQPFRVGFDPNTLSVEQGQDLENAFRRYFVTLVPVTENLVDKVWTQGRPKPVEAEVYMLPLSVAGEAVPQKLARVRSAMEKSNIDILPVVKLDQIAWLFNLRGQDISYNPLFLSYAIVTQDSAILFTTAHRIRKEDKAMLEQWATIRPYTEYFETLASLITQRLKAKKTAKVLIDVRHVPLGTLEAVKKADGEVIEADTPIQLMKALKNDIEIDGMKRANLQASRGKIRALKWLHDQLAAKQTVTEETFRQAIERFYAEEPHYVGLSFNTISGAGANSSIVHYGTPNPKKVLKPGELFLIDSGIQLKHGTTDDTRTVIIGKPTALQRKRFTEVLKAHINCAMQIFPKGTEGIRLDGITRSTLWNAGLDYGHGTGHGVGACLNVHEGPNGIHRMAKEPFQLGMITSIEPGYYEPRWGGIRLENLYVTVQAKGVTSSDGRPWYGFESLTYIPFDKRLIIKESLTREQLRWLKKYHQAIVRKIAPTLSESEAKWLKRVCDI